MLVIHPGEKKVLLVQRRFQLGPEQIGIQKVFYPNAGAGVLVHVARADSPASRADFVAGGFATFFLSLVEQLVIRHNDLASPADDKARPIHAFFIESGDFLFKRVRVKDDAAADDTGFTGVEHARGQQVKDVLFLADDDCVSSVGPALEASKDVHPRTERIDDTALAFVAPLGAD